MRRWQNVLASFAVLGTVGCSNSGSKQQEIPSTGSVHRAVPRAAGPAPIQLPINATSAPPGATASDEVLDRAAQCGRIYGNITAEQLADGRFAVSRTALIRSIDRLSRHLEQYGNYVAPPPAKTKQGEVGYAMLAIGSKATCGLLSKDYLVRVNGKLLSNPDERMAVYSSLSSVSTLEVEIERAGKPLTLVYLVRD